MKGSTGTDELVCQETIFHGICLDHGCIMHTQAPATLNSTVLNLIDYRVLPEYGRIWWSAVLNWHKELNAKHTAQEDLTDRDWSEEEGVDCMNISH
ncbi:hypothetical protein SLEP1_g856 [Rubroshorea leprosula]|uniref:Uncharacterized protein n=1 Tax=Rubroshorea leprosula TaxID=152421 RepID=A0AAV5HMC7_9ROSI|nr:hypothetical protein SLEP1_g856 [Rubroshorea leprosula]